MIEKDDKAKKTISAVIADGVWGHRIYAEGIIDEGAGKSSFSMRKANKKSHSKWLSWVSCEHKELYALTKEKAAANVHCCGRA